MHGLFYKSSLFSWWLGPRETESSFSAQWTSIPLTTGVSAGTSRSLPCFQHMRGEARNCSCRPRPPNSAPHHSFEFPPRVIIKYVFSYLLSLFHAECVTEYTAHKWAQLSCCKVWIKKITTLYHPSLKRNHYLYSLKKKKETKVLCPLRNASKIVKLRLLHGFCCFWQP